MTVSPEFLVSRFRSFQLWVSGFVLVATAVELWLEEHTGSAVQWIPFVLAGLGIAAILLVLAMPRKSTLWTLRLVMVAVLVGSVFGIKEHFEYNLAFELDIRPNAQPFDVFGHAFRGANPFLAPGILALAAVLAGSATFRHPALYFQEQEGQR